jgi:uncharacterized protein YbaP (TraB family)
MTWTKRPSFLCSREPHPRWRSLEAQALHRRPEPWRGVTWRLVAVALAIASTFVAGASGRIDAATRSFLWKATSGRGVVYLVGSVHMLTKDYYPLSPALDTAFKDSDLLVEEVDLGEVSAPDSQLQMLMRGMLPGGQSLEKVVSPSTFALVSKRVGDLGLPIEPLKRFKPWALAITLLGLEWQKAGFDPNLGLDKHFYDLAQVEGKAVQGLETIAYQISRFDEMSMDQQDRLLTETLRTLDTETASVSKLADAWKAGDAPTVERIVLQDLKQDPQMYQRLLVERNRNWLPTIDQLFARRGHAFVVVGAAHLVGPDGLLAMLRAKGYTVEQM